MINGKGIVKVLYQFLLPQTLSVAKCQIGIKYALLRTLQMVYSIMLFYTFFMLFQLPFITKYCEALLINNLGLHFIANNYTV